jgi:hypothetical protein
VILAIRISGDDMGEITDDELAFAGEQVFALYDAEEAGDGEANAR